MTSCWALGSQSQLITGAMCVCECVCVSACVCVSVCEREMCVSACVSALYRWSCIEWHKACTHMACTLQGSIALSAPWAGTCARRFNYTSLICCPLVVMCALCTHTPL